MGSRRLVPLLVMAVAAVTVLIVVLTRDDARDETPGGAATAPGVVDAPAEEPELPRAVEPERAQPTGLGPGALTTAGRAAPEPPAEEAEDDLPPDQMRYRITGRVVDAVGRPFPGVRVRLRGDYNGLFARGLGLDLHDHLWWEGEPAFAEAVTGPGGHFALDDARRRTAMAGWKGTDIEFPMLLLDTPGYAHGTHSLRGYRGEPEHDAGDVVYDGREARLRVSFVDEDGGPVAGVRAIAGTFGALDGLADAFVPLHPHRTAPLPGTSGPDGVLEIGGLFPCRLSLLFEPPEHRPLPLGVPTELRPGETTDLGTMTLDAGDGLSGVVVDERGDGLPGALVLACPVRHRSELSQDVAFLEESLFLDPRADDYVFRNLQGMVGRYLTADQGFRSARSDPSGAFRFGGLEAGAYDVLAATADREAVRLLDVSGDTRGLVLELAPMGRLVLTVLDVADDTPLPRAEILPFRETGLRDDDGEPARTRIEDDAVAPLGAGRFEVAGLSSRGNGLMVSAPGHAQQIVELPGVPPGETLEHVVRLSAAASVSGVLRHSSGEAVAGATVAAHSDAGAGFAVSDAEGRFRIEDLARGEWTLRVNTQQFVPPPRLTFSLETGQALDVGELLLKRAGRLHGTLLDRTGRPAAGVKVRAWNAAPGANSGRSTSSDASGRWSIDSLTEGPWLVSAFPGAEAEVTVAADDDLEVPLQLRSPPVLRGRVTAGGLPVADARVRHFETLELRGARNGRTQTQTGPDGRYELTLQEVGRISVLASAGGGHGEPVELDVRWDEDRVLDLTLGTALLAGQARHGGEGADGASLGDGGPAGGLQVRHTFEGDPFRTDVPVDEEGRFRIEHLRPGTHHLLLMTPGGPAGRLDVTLVEGERREGLVLWTGAPPPR